MHQLRILYAENGVQGNGKDVVFKSKIFCGNSYGPGRRKQFHIIGEA